MLSEYSAESLLEQLRQLDECQCIEAKRGSDIDSLIMQTVFVFVCEPKLGGGHLLYCRVLTKVWPKSSHHYVR